MGQLGGHPDLIQWQKKQLFPTLAIGPEPANVMMSMLEYSLSLKQTMALTDPPEQETRIADELDTLLLPQGFH